MTMKGRFEISASKRTIYVFIALWLIAVAVTSGFRPIAMLTGSWKTSTSTRYNFSVSHPKWWIAHSYGEGGYRGDDKVIFIIRSNFDPGFNGIEISRQIASDPTAWDVAEWGMDLRQQSGWRLNERQDTNLTQTPLESIEISEHTVLRRTFTSEGFADEDIYIARADDMIIITLRTSNGQYERYLDEFNRIWKSFTPLE
jgi:hypothetical protein